MASPRFLRSEMMKKARRTSGNLTLNSTSWADVDTGLDLTIDECQAGDEIVYGISGYASDEVVDAYFDVVTIVSGSPVNSFAERDAVVASPGARVAGWDCRESEQNNLSGFAPPYTIVAGDLTDGAITLRLRYATSTATNKTLAGGTSLPLDVWAVNLGPLQ